MAKTIHESIAGIDLLVPSVYDKFANGDPHLILNTGDARAFTPAPTLTPNIFKKGGQGPYALSFWVRSTGIENSKQFQFGVSNINGGGAGSLDHPWCLNVGMHLSGLNQITFTHMGTASQSVFISCAQNTNWQFYVINVPAPGSPITSYKNNDVALVSYANVTAGTPDYNPNQFFYIGRYGDSNPISTASDGKWLGKIAIHNRVLTLTECQLMYLEMTT